MRREPLRPRLRLLRPCAVALQRGAEVRRDFDVIVFRLDVGNRFACLIPHAPKRGTSLRPRLGGTRGTKEAMGFEDDLPRIDEHIAEARRLVQRQKGLIIRLRAGSSTWDAQRILWLLEANLRRLDEHSDRLRDQQN